MFRIKICGITNVEDALAAANAGADAIGLNYYRGSKRCIDAGTTAVIGHALADNVLRVGVFVNAEPSQVVYIAEQGNLSAVQLHGNESPEFLAQLPRWLPIVRALRCGKDGLTPLRDYLAECRAAGRMPDAILIDADSASDFGGTGRTADWARIANERRLIDDTPIILAGGLTPSNVAEAISLVQPHGVDVASGVENSPGKKDPLKVRDFVAAARSAFDVP